MKHMALCVAVIAMACGGLPANAAQNSTINSFNHALASATRTMDDAGILALWEDDGISLLPNTAPIVGKPAIAHFLAEVGQHLRGAHMQHFDLACHDAHTTADWGFEWCDAHQLVTLANGQPPFNGYGRMLLVLHRSAAHGWRLQREMWQPRKPS